MSTEKKELAVAGEQTLSARPDWAKDGRRGTEHMTKDDLRIPRILLAQALSPQLDESKPEYIEGLRNGEMFVDVTKKVLGRGPISFLVVRADKPRWVEFIPRSEGGGVKDGNVPTGDPRTDWTSDSAGNRIKPKATQFYDYILLMLPINLRNPMASVHTLSFKSTGIKVAKNLNTLMRLKDADIFAGVFSATSKSVPAPAKGTYNILSITDSGWADKAAYEVAEKMFEELRNKDVAFEREPGDDADEDLSESEMGTDM